MALVNELKWRGGTDTSDQIQTQLQELVDSGEIGVEGWSIVKSGAVALTEQLADNAAKGFDIDLSDFDFTSTDDYAVVVSVTTFATGVSYSFAKALWMKPVSTATNAKVAIVAQGGSVGVNVGLSYAVIAKTSANVKTLDEEVLYSKNNCTLKRIGSAYFLNIYDGTLAVVNELAPILKEHVSGAFLFPGIFVVQEASRYFGYILNSKGVVKSYLITTYAGSGFREMNATDKLYLTATWTK